MILSGLPLERLRVPQASGHTVTYVPVQFGSFAQYPLVGKFVDDRLIGLLVGRDEENAQPVVPDRIRARAE